MFNVYGKLEYFNNWAVVWVNDDIAKYYRSICPKAWYLKPPMYRAHITVVRKDIEIITNTKNWKKYNGKMILLNIDPIVKSSDLYAWLDVYSYDLGTIRERLGLSRYRNGFDRYHLTIGNFKS